jgi:hypothetical protein
MAMAAVSRVAMAAVSRVAMAFVQTPQGESLR